MHVPEAIEQLHYAESTQVVSMLIRSKLLTAYVRQRSVSRGLKRKSESTFIRDGINL